MSYIVVVIILFMLSCGASADMGYFGTIAQNPVPLELPVHPSIELTAEDVLIEMLPAGQAELTADFLFTNTGPADTVLMYFPVSIMVPTISVLWSLDDLTDPLTEPVVAVNGEAVEVRPLLCMPWNREYRDPAEWEALCEMFEVLVPAEEPDSGLVFFLADAGIWSGLNIMEWVSSDSITDLTEAVLNTRSSHALWSVPFGAGESLRVTYSIAYSLRYAWENPILSMTYPLYTGGSWAGNIGSGRIVATAEPGGKFAGITGWSSVSMPEGTEELDYLYLSLPAMVEAPGRSPLTDRYGETMEMAVVWTFEEFEPVVSPMGWMYYYEDPEDINARYYAEEMSWPEKPPQWPSSIRVEVFDGDFEQY